MMMKILKILLFLGIISNLVVRIEGYDHRDSMKKPTKLKNPSINSQHNPEDFKLIRITKNTTVLDKGLSDSNKDYIHSIIDAALSLIQNMIMVIPTQGNNFFTSDKRICEDVKLSTDDYQNGIQNSDLHIYITHFLNTNSTGTVATGTSCTFIKNKIKNHPNFGQISLNLTEFGDTNSSPQKFQQDLNAFLHEMIHVLGFQGTGIEEWNLPRKKEFYTVSVEHNEHLYSYLRTPNNSRSMWSHWVHTLFTTEIMNPYIGHYETYLTLLSLGLLNDTGFWGPINENLAYPIQLALEEECSMVTNECEKETNFDFMNPKSFCKPIVNDHNQICDDPNKEYDCTQLRLFNCLMVNYGIQNQCIISNLNYKFTTIKDYECLFHQTQIRLSFTDDSEFFFTCGPKDQNKEKPVFYKGEEIGKVKCPEDYNYFCDFKICEKYCSHHGICVRGYCQCLKGYTGTDCSISIKDESKSFYEKNSFVEQCRKDFFANPDNTCQRQCPIGYFKNEEGNKCSLCDFSCSKCTGPLPTQCIACQFLTYLHGSTCVEICPEGTYHEKGKQICLKCPTGCKKCKTWNDCLECNSTQYQLSTKNQCVDKYCDQNQCNTCTNLKQCTSCPVDMFLNVATLTCLGKDEYCPTGTFKNSLNNTCSLCPTGCTKCLSLGQCKTCDKSLGYFLYQETCTICDPNCNTCSPKNLSYCTSCKDGKFLLSTMCVSDCPKQYYKGPKNSCLPCKKGCRNCKNDGSCIKYKQYP